MKRIAVILDEKLLEELKQKAKKDCRSVNSLVNILIKRCVTQEHKHA